MGDRTKAHALRGLRGERRTPTAAAKEYEAFVFRERRLVIGAFRIDPKFEHAARAMKGAGDAAFALQLRTSRRSTKVTSSRPCCAIASSTGKVSISRSAASTSARNP